jgi:hypothetical protein
VRYQWITRLLGNPLSDEIMEPFSRLGRAADQPIVLIQSKVGTRC